jgi:hypothetical protein
MDLLNRETRRERILDNRNKAIKIKEKQRAILEKSKEFEKIREEEKLKKFGCPIQRAEKRFFESIEQTMKEREARNAELLTLLQ